MGKTVLFTGILVSILILGTSLVLAGAQDDGPTPAYVDEDGPVWVPPNGEGEPPYDLPTLSPEEDRAAFVAQFLQNVSSAESALAGAAGIECSLKPCLRSLDVSNQMRNILRQCEQKIPPSFLRASQAYDAAPDAMEPIVAAIELVCSGIVAAKDELGGFANTPEWRDRAKELLVTLRDGRERAIDAGIHELLD